MINSGDSAFAGGRLIRSSRTAPCSIGVIIDLAAIFAPLFLFLSAPARLFLASYAFFLTRSRFAESRFTKITHTGEGALSFCPVGVNFPLP